jgi:hypothetical protein
LDPLRVHQAGVSIVLVGAFNPQIFQPAWLAAQGLLDEEEAETADILIIRPEVVVFRLDWCDIEITTERFVITTARAPSPEPIRDLTLGAFGILRHTPIRLMGLNRTIHYQLSSEEALLAMMETLASTEPWQDVLRETKARTVVVHGERPDEFEGLLGVTVEPSQQIASGLYVAFNDHFQLPMLETVEDSRPMLSTLNEAWEPSRERFEAVVEALVATE